MGDSDLQFCIIGSSLYKSAPLHSTSPSRWYISKKFHLNVTLKACHAEDHSKCQNSLMRPMTEFRISLCHIFLEWIPKTKLCLWNLDSDLCCYSVSLPSKVQTFFQFISVFKAQYAWKKRWGTLSWNTFFCHPLEELMWIMAARWILIFAQIPIFFYRMQRKVNSISSTVHRIEHEEIQKKWIPTALITQNQSESLNTFKGKSEWNSLDS